MADVLWKGEILTRERMVEALVEAQGANQATNMLRGRTCPLFDEACNIEPAFARQIVRWLEDRWVGALKIVKPRTRPEPMLFFSPRS